MERKIRLNPDAVRDLCRLALTEDLGSGDATTTAVIPPELRITATLRCRQESVLCGMPVVEALYRELDQDVHVEIRVAEGGVCAAGDVAAVLTGPARAILSGERAALNFLQRLSGIATGTRAYVAALGETRTRLLDTRKTTPGLRMLEKYAVAAGGGSNHRAGLFDQIMIKDNHRYAMALAGTPDIAQAIAACKDRYPTLDVEIEVDSLEQLEEALRAGADWILLDNMSTAELIEAVTVRDRIRSQTLLEASGGITLTRIPEIRDIGLDFISVGALTHSAPAVDMGLDLQEPGQYP